MAASELSFSYKTILNVRRANEATRILMQPLHKYLLRCVQFANLKIDTKLSSDKQNMMCLTNKLFAFFIFSLFVFCSCQSQPTKEQNTNTIQQTPTVVINEPNYNYKIVAPQGWTIRDTTMQGGLKIRLLISPQSLESDYPAGNVLIASMEGRNIDEFTNRNINYLKSNMPGITILERGNIDAAENDGRWFTYTKEQNGIVRDMVNYIIPLNGFAYMITCGSNKGSIDKYRATFDNIVKSFKG